MKRFIQMILIPFCVWCVCHPESSCLVVIFSQKIAPTKIVNDNDDGDGDGDGL